MLPPGHLAAGFLVSNAFLHYFKPDLSSHQIHQLVLWGTFCGFVPDLDMFYAFYRAKGLTIPGTDINHRKYVSHLPILWLIAGLGIYVLAHSTFIQYAGLLLGLGSWSHFILDSLQDGIMWLWPFNSRQYAYREPGAKVANNTKGFFNYWLHFLNYYRTERKITFYLEISILAFLAATLVR